MPAPIGAGRLAIVGAGGHARVAADCAETLGWERVTMFDPDFTRPSGVWSVAGEIDALFDQLHHYDAVALGLADAAARLESLRCLTAAGAPVIALIHPTATVSSHAVIGAGSVVFAGAVINIGARLGRAVIVNTGATVDHDCVLEDGVHVAPGAHLAGGVVVGAESWIGVGAVVREYTAIGARVTVGAGAVVVKPVADGLVVAGNPARPLER